MDAHDLSPTRPADRLRPQVAARPARLAPQRAGAGRDLLAAGAAATGAHGHAGGVLLLGLGEARGSGLAAPTLLARQDEDFLDGLQADLAAPGGVAAVRAAAAAIGRDARGRLRFFPPIQRVHQLVLVEACCPQPGLPRLDPRRIASAGLVIRQVSGQGGWLAWQRADGRAIGWQPLATGLEPRRVHQDDDPDPAHRAPRVRAGQARIDAALRALRIDGPARAALAGSALAPAAADPAPERLGEKIVPLHPLPPALCEALGRTLLVGYLPVASDEVVEPVAAGGPAAAAGAARADLAGLTAAAPRPAGDAADLAALAAHLMHPLKAGGLKPLPRAGQRLAPEWLDTLASLADAPPAALAAADGSADLGAPERRATARWVQTLLQLQLELDVLAEDLGTPADAGLGAALDGLRVIHLGAAAREAAGALLEAWLEELSAARTAWSPDDTAALLQAHQRAGRFGAAGDPLVEALLARWRTRPGGFGDADALALFGSGGWLAEGEALRRVGVFLAAVQLSPARAWLRDSVAALVGDRPEDGGAPGPVQGDYWAPVGAAAATALLGAAEARLRQREAALFAGQGAGPGAAAAPAGEAAAPGGRRLAEPDRPMVVRCFVRLKPEGGCPPVLAWSAPSEPFTVAPWWEAGGRAPRVVEMPDPFDRGLLRKLKPNIGFALPGKLGGLMTPANLARLAKGEKPAAGSGLALDWICAFNIPIITICALIVLMIFLQLLNLVFWWLPFVKLCLPLPRRK